MPFPRRPILLLTAVLAVPIFPVVLLGLAFEDKAAAWMRTARVPPAGRFALVAGLLATDILLPIPSSAVTTWAGGVMGMWPAAAASTIGMTAGAVVGFALARAMGAKFVSRRAGERDLDKSAALYHRFGPLALVLTRALPILAEACVLLMGASGLSWRRFLPPVIASNCAVSLTYAACGQYFQGRDALPIAVVASGTVPLLLALVARKWLPGLAGKRVERSRPSPDGGEVGYIEGPGGANP